MISASLCRRLRKSVVLRGSILPAMEQQAAAVRFAAEAPEVRFAAAAPEVRYALARPVSAVRTRRAAVPPGPV
jgi:hypothetical protein